jgi:O-antigen/teichoic acid export membrane protein
MARLRRRDPAATRFPRSEPEADRPALTPLNEGESTYDADQRATGSTADLSRVFRRGFAETFAFDVAARAFSAASIILLIRGLSVSAYAFVTLFLILAQFLASAAGGGVRLRYLRREAERVSRGEAGEAASFGTALVSGSLLIAAIGFAFLPIVYFFIDVPAAGTPIGLIVYSVGFAIGWAATELTVAHYQARMRFGVAGAINVLRAAVVLATSIVVVAMGANQSSGLALGFLGGMVAVGGVTTGWILRQRNHVAQSPLRQRLVLTSEEGWLTIYFLAGAGFAYVDVMVAAMFLSAKDIATLGATLRYLSVALAAIPAMGAVLRVRVSQSDILDSGENQRRLVLSWLRLTALPAAVVLAVSIVLIPVVIPMIDGGRYPGSIIALQIFLPSAALAYMTEPGANVLMAQDRNAMLALLFALALTINFVGDLIVAPAGGVTGIAVVSSACFVALRVAVTLVSLRTVDRAVIAPESP